MKSEIEILSEVTGLPEKVVEFDFIPTHNVKKYGKAIVREFVEEVGTRIGTFNTNPWAAMLELLQEIESRE